LYGRWLFSMEIVRRFKSLIVEEKLFKSFQ
jgi:hypothetical protein